MIKIANRFQPFSHTPGVKAVIPFTDVTIQAFPTKIIFSREKVIHEIDLLITGPVKEFTLVQDLEEGCIRIFGKSLEGYFNLEFSRGVCKLTRGEKLNMIVDGKEKMLQKKESFSLFNTDNKKTETYERLSFGCHKKLDCDLMLRRFDLSEMLPLLFFLSQKVDSQESSLKELIEKLEFESFLKVHFSHIFAPEREDKNHLGLSWKAIPESIPLMSLFSMAYKSIKNLVLKEEGEKLLLLPLLFPEFHAGRLLSGKVSFGKIDLEWAKRKLKKAIITAEKDAVFQITTPTNFSTFRLKRQPKEKGVILPITEILKIKKHERYFLDKFEM